MTASRIGIAIAASLIASACTDMESTTNLNPEGPPMIRQVRFRETSKNANGGFVDKLIFGFGLHPLATENDYPAGGPGSETTATATGQKFRIIMDELLIGNNLEEIKCRATIDNDNYDTVPLGATPDDIARCAAPSDVLTDSCPGSMTHAVCICKLDAGCITPNGTIAKGAPVGVEDQNGDGASDDSHFLAGSVGIQCGPIAVPINIDQSYWNPSGDQNKPAMGGFDVLGPAIVLTPEGGVLPTNTECNLVFAPNIVDKQNIQVCAPEGGDIEKGCTPGDVSAFKFNVTPLRVTQVTPATGASVTAPIFLASSAPVDLDTLGAITFTQGGNPVPDATIVVTGTTSIKITATLAADTTYDIDVTTALTDTFGQALPMPYHFTVTTAP
jgi:hypothetical protein